MVKINGERLIADLQHLRSFGATGNGVDRRSLTPVDVESRHWLAGRFAEAGLDAEIDGVGNVLGWSPNPGPALLLGSHTDTQPSGGWLDGAMGVMYAIEVVRALSETESTRSMAVDIASWIDEEGTFAGFLGSRSFCFGLDATELEQATRKDGRRLEDELRSAGFAGRAPARFNAGRHVGYLEAHIEQGPRLEAEGQRIGIVTGIVGMRDFEISFTGQQNHAGTTPMPLRRDAGVAAIEFGHRIRQTFGLEAPTTSVHTIGAMRFEPGSSSIIPGQASLILQIRDPSAAALDEMEASARRTAGEVGTDLDVESQVSDRVTDAAPAQMDQSLQEALSAAAEDHVPGEWISMPSGAGHDAQILSQVMPSGMLFVPSIGGVSHHTSEDTSEEDIVMGCQVLATACAKILKAGDL